ncbi:hypothetical protein BJ322DRAFT_775885 [Thelephora terrestris]|uniref:Uncharacterized protein n=1 Tax=Thelephora terrestris TaxID=56493 RepID=A0A9P6L7Q4_9AGAM|nr:hypothetical protein BJ322DRAFT_775885 [Thelephora terrestris]
MDRLLVLSLSVVYICRFIRLLYLYGECHSGGVYVWCICNVPRNHSNNCRFYFRKGSWQRRGFEQVAAWSYFTLHNRKLVVHVYDLRMSHRSSGGYVALKSFKLARKHGRSDHLRGGRLFFCLSARCSFPGMKIMHRIGSDMMMIPKRGLKAKKAQNPT